MSVEEARQALEEDISNYALDCSGDDCESACAVAPYETIERLIMEVQGAMDCRFWAWRQTCDERYYETEMDTKWCKRCVARKKLAEKVTASVIG